MLHRISLLPLLGSLFLLAAVARAQRNANQIVRFNFRYGFFQDDQTPDTDIMKDDIEGVICQTQYFLSQIVQNATDSKSVHARATEIDWGYYEGQDTPAHINFTVEFDDAEVEGDVNAIDDEMLINKMQELDNTALQKYITEWVWKSEPVGLNFFVNANRMAFDGVQQAPVEGVLKEAECPETTAPTHAPTTSMPPTTGPTISPAPTTEAEKNNNPGGNDGPNGPSGAGGFPNGGIGGFGGPNANGNGNGNPNGGNGNPNDPNGGNGGNGGPGGNRGDWPFGPNYETFADLKPMADFSLSFSMFEDHEVPPTVEEVNALICQINGYFTEELRRKLTAPDIHMKAVYIDYYFEEGGKGSNAEDIRLNFTAFTYYGRDAHEQVVVQDVFQSMKLRDAELKDLVENYVWKSEPEQENVFYHTESLGLNAGMGAELDPSKAIIVEASGCILPPDDDGTPFEGIPGPGSNVGEGGPGAGGAGGNGNGNGGNPPDLGLGGDAKQTEITVNFRVSNLENIKEENAVKASGLDSSFPAFTNELVNELTQRDALARRVLRNGRRLRVVPIPGTATVNELQEYDCPASALPGLTCHSARAKYDVLMSSEEDTAQVQTTYTDASETAVNDGTYNNVLQRVDPNTPLYIGIMTDKSQIPPGSLKRGYDGEPDNDDDGWFKWWYILILLLLLLLCCLCCLYCMVLNKKDEPAKETTIEEEEREVLVEEFDDEPEGEDDEEPDDEDEDEEEFVDDPDAAAAAAGVMVPYDPNQAPAPAPAPMPPPTASEPEPPVAEQGVLVPYDPKAEKAHQDQAERERILGGSSNNLEHKKDDDQTWEEDV